MPIATSNLPEWISAIAAAVTAAATIAHLACTKPLFGNKCVTIHTSDLEAICEPGHIGPARAAPAIPDEADRAWDESHWVAFTKALLVANGFDLSSENSFADRLRHGCV